MGKNNRARRAAKHRRERRHGSTNTSSARRADSWRQAPPVAEVVWAAAEAHRFRDPSCPTLLALLAQLDGAAGAVDEQLMLVTLRVLDGGGWLPDDLPRVVERKLTAAHAVRAAAVSRLAGERLAAGTVATERWSASLAAVAERAGPAGRGDTHLRVGVELLSFLAYLPRIPQVEPPPGAPATAAARRSAPVGDSSRYLEKVRALLAKAESTTFPEEAEALTAKAQELIARHSIDTALLDDRADATAPIAVRIWLDDPYSEAKMMLLAAVARANRARAVWSSDMGFATVFGFAHDLDAIELLYTSLRVQAVTAMTGFGSVRDRSGTSRTRSFRRSFLEGFAQRIGERLREATDASVEAARAEHGDAALLPVLRRRDDDVAAAQRAAFPHLTQRVIGGSFHPGGWAAGRTAADLAHLGADVGALAPRE